MKLHHRVLLTLAACASVGLTLADETWNYTSNTTYNYATTDNGDGTTTTNAPVIPTEGDIIKTGAGTVTLDLGRNGASSEDVNATASDFTGDVYINEGAIRLGADDAGGAGDSYRMSPAALGTEGTIYVASGASFNLGISQNSNTTTTFNKAISLDGGKLYFDDGKYKFAKTLTLTADSTIQNEWSGKSHTFVGLNAAGHTLSITGQSTSITFDGTEDVAFGKLVVNKGTTVQFSRPASGKTFTAGDIELGENATLKLNITQNGTTALAAVKMGKNATLTSLDGNYTMTSLTITESATLKHHWGKTFTINSLQAEGATLNVVAGVEGEKTSAWVKIGGGSGELKSKLGTLDIQSGNVQITSSENEIGTVNVADGSVLQVGGAGVVLHAETINLAAGSKLRLDNGGAYHPTMGSDTSVINVNATSDKAVVIAAGVYGQMTLKSDIVGTGKLTLRRSETGYQNNVNLSGVLSGDMEITHETGKYTLNSTNTYSGGTIIKGGGDDYNITANASGALGTGAVTMVNTGKLIVNAGKTQTNTVNFMSDDTTSVATLSGASWEGTTLTGTTATGGSITGGTLAVTGTFTATNVNVTGSTLDVASGGNLTMTGALDKTSSVAVASGGTIDLSGATLATSNVLELENLTLADDATLTLASEVDTVTVNGTLDLSDVTTLDFAVLNLATDATLILGEQPIELSGTLTMGDNVTIDLSAWCKNDSSVPGDKTIFQPYMTIMTYGADSALTFDSSLEGKTVTIIVDGYVNECGWLTITEDGKALQLVPEPATATLSLLALAGLAARRRRK